MMKRQRCCLSMVLLLAGLGILATGYYLGSKSEELKLYREHVWDKQTSVKTGNGVAPHKSLSAKDVNDVETFLFFIGYPRSGHSILASMIDAHPNAIVAHEFNVFPKLYGHLDLLTNKTALYNALYQNSGKQLAHGWRSMDHSFTSKGYSLKLEGSQSWQGKFRRLKVIGDKSGGITVRMYRDRPSPFIQVYQQLSKLVHVPLKAIHMVRNPYDMLATRLLYRFSNQRRQKANFTSAHPVNNPGNVSQAMKNLYSEAKAVVDMSRELSLSVLEVHNVDFIENPRREMRRMCQFLGLQCSTAYLDMVVQSTFTKLSVTRHSLVWREEARRFIDTHILSFPFFNRYSFSKD